MARDELRNPLVEDSSTLQLDVGHEAMMNGAYESSHRALCFDARVPLVIRVVMPLLILLGMALFLWSNLSYAASVNVSVSLLQNAGLPGGNQIPAAPEMLAPAALYVATACRSCVSSCGAAHTQQLVQ